MLLMVILLYNRINNICLCPLKCMTFWTQPSRFTPDLPPMALLRISFCVMICSLNLQGYMEESVTSFEQVGKNSVYISQDYSEKLVERTGGYWWYLCLMPTFRRPPDLKVLTANHCDHVCILLSSA